MLLGIERPSLELRGGQFARLPGIVVGNIKLVGVKGGTAHPRHCFDELRGSASPRPVRLYFRLGCRETICRECGANVFHNSGMSCESSDGNEGQNPEGSQDRRTDIKERSSGCAISIH